MDEKLDCVGVRCPVSLVKISRRMKAIGPGDTLTVVADDRAFRQNVTAWCQKMGQELVRVEESGGESVATIRKR